MNGSEIVTCQAAESGCENIFHDKTRQINENNCEEKKYCKNAVMKLLQRMHRPQKYARCNRNNGKKKNSGSEDVP